MPFSFCSACIHFAPHTLLYRDKASAARPPLRLSLSRKVAYGFSVRQVRLCPRPLVGCLERRQEEEPKRALIMPHNCERNAAQRGLLPLPLWAAGVRWACEGLPCLHRSAA